MTASINTIDWPSLTHAYGPAADVPGQLRALLSPHKGTWDAALGKLYGNIWHQHTVYEASAPAAACLIDIAARPEVRCRPEILQLLRLIAEGTSYHDVHGDSILFGAESKTPAWREKVERELGWVRAARAAVRDGVPTFIALLADADAETRAAAAYTLGTFAAEDDGVARALLDRLAAEDDPAAAASLTLAIGAAGESAERVAALSRLHTDSPDPLARTAAAMGLAAMLRGRTPEAATLTLADALAAVEGTLASRYNALPWCSNGLDADASGYLSLAKPLGPAATQRLLSYVREARNPLAGEQLLHVLYAVLFADRGPKPSDPFDTLSPLQRDALRAFGDNDALWLFNANVGHALHALGLPSTWAAYRAHVGLPPKPEPTVASIRALRGREGDAKPTEGAGNGSPWRRLLARLFPGGGR